MGLSDFRDFLGLLFQLGGRHFLEGFHLFGLFLDLVGLLLDQVIGFCETFVIVKDTLGH